MPIHSEYTESFSEFTQKTKDGHPPEKKQRSSAQITEIKEKYYFAISYIFQSNSKTNQAQHNHSTFKNSK